MIKFKNHYVVMFCYIVFFVAFLQKNTYSQNNKKPLDFSVYNSWNYINKAKISNDGKYVSYELNPYKGDGNLYFVTSGKQEQVIERAYNAEFSSNSTYSVFKIKAQLDTVRALKLKKVKKDKLPKDSLGIYVFKTKKIEKFPGLKYFKIPKETSDWFAYMSEQKGKEKSNKDTVDNENKKKTKKKKEFDKNAPKVSDLVIYNPITNKKHLFKNISEYEISRNGKYISFIKLQNDTILNSKVFFFNTISEKLDSLRVNTGLSKIITLNNSGTYFSYIHSKDTIKEKVYSLYLHNIESKSTKLLVDTLTKEIPDKWTVSETGKIYFSRDDTKLYFGTKLKPEPEPKDTVPEDEKIVLDIWSWTDKRLQPQQKANLEDDKKQTYLAVYHLNENKIVQIGDEDLFNIKTIQKGNHNTALGVDYRKHQMYISWDSPSYKDYYIINVQTGKRKLIYSKTQDNAYLSSSGKYVLKYSYSDSSWYSYNIKSGKEVSLTKKIDSYFYDIEHDYPMYPNHNRFAGWSENDEYVLINDYYDIWKLDPTGKNKPINLTNGYGKTNKTVFRYIETDKEADFINTKNPLLLSSFNKINKKAGFYNVNFKKVKPPKLLISDNNSFNIPIKAKNEDKYLWKKSSCTEYPNLWYSNLDFSGKIKISDANPQQKDYNWCSVEIFKWTLPNGKEEEGLLYKPENFDPNKKYPVMVYFYRLYSDRLNTYRSPKPSRSTINPTFYASNGYLVFIPNIRYKIGHPGKSCTEYIVSGTEALCKRPYVDKDNMAVQGQSWGGYQVSYLITQTNLYNAAGAGAPVSNMTSAYGGIRWKSGMSRMFQYEKSQSRIGATLWERRDLYIENSPVFFADKVETPLLIMHNDNDGAVPWYQGIEYFVALRRLQKPVWMINYNGEPHNLKNKSPNCTDLSIRLMQFFDHYLKGKPAPVWLKYGIPAIKKGKTLGYEYGK